ncbi:MAG: hypothetical protein F7B20_01040 [Aeropyrum sp.]|nr:hypothetical protein [Aeropyrum sp.]MCE4616547.1 hypothetical protein [Aeropyrum sp.]
MAGDRKPGLVDTLWSLDLIASRIYRAHSEFVLAGPASLWLQGLRVEPKPYFIVVTSRQFAGDVSRVLRIGSTVVEWEGWWSAVSSGREARLKLRGADVAVLTDPILEDSGTRTVFPAGELARESSIAIVNNQPIKLAPISFEAALWDASGGSLPWRVGGLGGTARK